jgi:hypothetical protein
VNPSRPLLTSIERDENFVKSVGWKALQLVYDKGQCCFTLWVDAGHCG